MKPVKISYFVKINSSSSSSLHIHCLVVPAPPRVGEHVDIQAFMEIFYTADRSQCISDNILFFAKTQNIKSNELIFSELSYPSNDTLMLPKILIEKAGSLIIEIRLFMKRELLNPFWVTYKTRYFIRDSSVSVFAHHWKPSNMELESNFGLKYTTGPAIYLTDNNVCVMVTCEFEETTNESNGKIICAEIILFFHFVSDHRCILSLFKILLIIYKFGKALQYYIITILYLVHQLSSISDITSYAVSAIQKAH